MCAQVLTAISLRLAPGAEGVYSEGIVACTGTIGGLSVQIRTSRGAQGVTVNTLAYTVSSYNRLRNHNVQAFLENRETLAYRFRGAATYTGNSTAWFWLAAFGNGAGSPCFPDGKLITSDSVIRVVLMPATRSTRICGRLRLILEMTPERNATMYPKSMQMTASCTR